MTVLDDSERALTQANALLDLRRFTEAQTLAQTAIVNVRDPRWLVVLTRAHLGQEGYGAAVDSAQRLIQSEPDNEAGHRLLSIALVGMDRGADAVRTADRAVQLAPNSWAASYTMARALLAARRPADAIDWAERACELAPNLSDPHVLLGLALVQNRLTDEGRRSFEEALRLKPDDPYALQHLANLDARQGRLRAAGGWTRAGLGAAPNAQGLHVQYDLILWRLLRRTYLAALPFGWVLYLLTQQPASAWMRPLIGTVMLVALSAVVTPIIRALPGSPRTAVGRMLRQSGASPRLLLAALLLLLIGAIVVAFAPEQVAKSAGTIALRGLEIIGVVSTINLLIRRSTRRQGRRP